MNPFKLGICLTPNYNFMHCILSLGGSFTNYFDTILAFFWSLTYLKLILVLKEYFFSNFSCMFMNPNNFFQFDPNCSNLLDMRNIQKQVKKAFCYQRLFWPFTVWINCSSDFKLFATSLPSASNFKSFSRSLEQFFLAVGRNNFGNKVPFLKNKRNLHIVDISTTTYYLPCLFNVVKERPPNDKICKNNLGGMDLNFGELELDCLPTISISIILIE